MTPDLQEFPRGMLWCGLIGLQALMAAARETAFALGIFAHRWCLHMSCKGGGKLGKAQRLCSVG